MKNKKLNFWFIFINVLNVSLLIFIIISFILFFNTEMPEEINENEFIGYMKNKGCNLIDVQEEKKYLGVETYLVTDEKTCPYLVSYTKLFSEYSYDDFFDTLYDDVVNRNNNVNEKNIIKMDLFYKYYEYSTSGDFYKALTLNKNSILYASADIKYKNEVIGIFKDFNYFNAVTNNDISYVFYAVFLVVIIDVISLWKIEKKIRNKGWIALVPVYNIMCLSKDVLGSSSYVLLLFLPIGNSIFLFVLYYKLGKVFDKSNVFSLLLTLFPNMFLPMLAFDDSVYSNPKKEEDTIVKDETVNTNSKPSTSIFRKVINLIKWIFAVIFIFFAFTLSSLYLEEHLIIDLILSISFLIYGLMICPKVTDYTGKFKTYTKYKMLVVILLIVIDFIFISILPV